MRVDRDMPDPAASRPPLFVRMEGAYLPIPLASLRVDTVTDFDLYIQTNPAQSPVLYRERSFAFTEVERRRLETSRISALLVMAADAGAYRRYAEKNLGALLSDNTLPLGDRSAVLYVTAQLAVREMLRDPDKRRAVEQSMPLVENTILFMANNDAALGHLLRVSSYDYFTYTHSVNVCIYAIALARQYGRFDAPELRQLGQGALLHDVGKTLIYPQLLTMPGRLGKMQLETMKQHPILGFDLLREAGGVS